MAGGFIYQKTIDSAYQGGTDKSLLIEPNYAYQVPFTFGDDWEDIKIGMFVSYVITGAGNENSGVANGTTSTAGGTSNDTFNYVGIVKEGATSTLPLDTNNSGYLGLQADGLYTFDSSVSYYNKLYHSAESSFAQGDARFLASHGATTLETKEFQDAKGNFNVVSLRDSDAEAEDGSPETTGLFCDYWGLRYQVIDKGASTQKIRFTASLNGTSASDNSTAGYDAISDPSIAALKSFINGVGEFSYTGGFNMHTLITDGFVWNDGVSGHPLPDSLFFYNAFQNLRPRIHAWAVKKIS